MCEYNVVINKALSVYKKRYYIWSKSKERQSAMVLVGSKQTKITYWQEQNIWWVCSQQIMINYKNVNYTKSVGACGLINESTSLILVKKPSSAFITPTMK